MKAGALARGAVDSQWHEGNLDWTQLDHVIELCAARLLQFAGIVVRHLLHHSVSVRVVPAREPHRYGGRTLCWQNVSVQ